VPSSEEGSAKPPGGHPPAKTAGYLKCVTAGWDSYFIFQPYYAPFAFGCPLAVTRNLHNCLERRQISTAALRFAPCFRHRRRSQPHPPAKTAGYLKCVTAGWDSYFIFQPIMHRLQLAALLRYAKLEYLFIILRMV